MSDLLRAVPIITELLHALEASMTRIREGRHMTPYNWNVSQCEVCQVGLMIDIRYIQHIQLRKANCKTK